MWRWLSARSVEMIVCECVWWVRERYEEGEERGGEEMRGGVCQLDV